MKKLLILGGSGLVGERVISFFRNRYDLDTPDLNELNILDKNSLDRYIDSQAPEIILNLAAYTNVPQAEQQRGDKEGIVYRLNAEAVKSLAGICKSRKIHLLHASTEYIFDGEKTDNPYLEQDQPNPKNWYGMTKFIGEEFIRDSGCNFSIFRLSMPYSPHYELKKDIARTFIDRLKNGQVIKAITDAQITPVLIDDLAKALTILIDQRNWDRETFHLVSADSVSPFDFARLIAQTFQLSDKLIQPITYLEYTQGKEMLILKNSWMSCQKFVTRFGSNILHANQEGVKLLKKEIDSLV